MKTAEEMYYDMVDNLPHKADRADYVALMEAYAIHFKPEWISVGNEMAYTDIDQDALYVIIRHGLKAQLIKGNKISTYFLMGQIDKLFKLPAPPTT